MNYIIMDLEFNQPFDFSNKAKKKPNPEIPFEIIQIGCVKLDENMKKIDDINLMIKPIVYKRLHPFVQKITGFNQGSFVDGLTFIEAYEKLSEFVNAQESVFCVWGDVDLKLLFKNISYYKQDKGLMPKEFVNVQKLAGKKLSWASGNLIGLKTAIEEFEIEIDLPFHDAFNDAHYTSLILKKLDGVEENIGVYQISKKAKKSNKNDLIKQTDIISLYNYVEKELGRKITKKEKTLFKNVYLLGVNKKIE